MSKKTKQMVNVRDVLAGYKYYQRILYNEVISVIEYQGLPDSLPKQIIENNLLRTGYSPIWNDKNFGLITMTHGGSWAGGLSGQDIYFRPTVYTGANPNTSNIRFKIYPYWEMTSRKAGLPEEEGVVVFNSALDSSMVFGPSRGISNVVNRYARLLAEIDSSIATLVVNSRATAIATATTQATAEAVRLVLDKVKEGSDDVVINKNSMQAIKKLFENIPSNSEIQYLIDAKQKILGEYYERVGILKLSEKRERYISSEIDSHNEVLDLVLEGMIEQRQKDFEFVNQLFGTNIRVSLHQYDALIDEDTTPEETPEEERPEQQEEAVLNDDN